LRWDDGGRKEEGRRKKEGGRRKEEEGGRRREKEGEGGRRREKEEEGGRMMKERWRRDMKEPKELPSPNYCIPDLESQVGSTAKFPRGVQTSGIQINLRNLNSGIAAILLNFRLPKKEVARSAGCQKRVQEKWKCRMKENPKKIKQGKRERQKNSNKAGSGKKNRNL
jgi:hypothetical protein